MASSGLTKVYFLILQSHRWNCGFINYVMFWDVLVGLEEHLMKGSKDILRLPSLSVTNVTSQAIPQLLRTSAWCRGWNKLARSVREAVFLRVNDPFQKGNIGKYHLPRIWDDVLINTSELKWNILQECMACT